MIRPLVTEPPSFVFQPLTGWSQTLHRAVYTIFVIPALNYGLERTENRIAVSLGLCFTTGLNDCFLARIPS